MCVSLKKKKCVCLCFLFCQKSLTLILRIPQKIGVPYSQCGNFVNPRNNIIPSKNNFQKKDISHFSTTPTCCFHVPCSLLYILGFVLIFTFSCCFPHVFSSFLLEMGISLYLFLGKGSKNRQQRVFNTALTTWADKLKIFAVLLKILPLWE